MSVAKCIRSIFDGRPNRGILYKVGDIVDIDPTEEWPGVKDLKHHFIFGIEKKEYVFPEVTFPDEVPTPGIEAKAEEKVEEKRSPGNPNWKKKE